MADSFRVRSKSWQSMSWDRTLRRGRSVSEEKWDPGITFTPTYVAEEIAMASLSITRSSLVLMTDKTLSPNHSRVSNTFVTGKVRSTYWQCCCFSSCESWCRWLTFCGRTLRALVAYSWYQNCRNPDTELSNSEVKGDLIEGKIQKATFWV